MQCLTVQDIQCTNEPKPHTFICRKTVVPESSYSGIKLPPPEKRPCRSTLYTPIKKNKCNASLFISYNAQTTQISCRSTQENCNVGTVLSYCGTKVLRLKEKRHHWSKIYHHKENKCTITGIVQGSNNAKSVMSKNDAKKNRFFKCKLKGI